METSWTPMTWSATKIAWSYVPSGKLTELWKITILIGKTSINGPLSIAMFVYQRVFLSIPKERSRILSHTQNKSCKITEQTLENVLGHHLLPFCCASKYAVASFFDHRPAKRPAKIVICGQQISLSKSYLDVFSRRSARNHRFSPSTMEISCRCAIFFPTQFPLLGGREGSWQLIRSRCQQGDIIQHFN